MPDRYTWLPRVEGRNKLPLSDTPKGLKQRNGQALKQQTETTGRPSDPTLTENSPSAIKWKNEQLLALQSESLGRPSHQTLTENSHSAIKWKNEQLLALQSEVVGGSSPQTITDHSSSHIKSKNEQLLALQSESLATKRSQIRDTDAMEMLIRRYRKMSTSDADRLNNWQVAASSGDLLTNENVKYRIASGSSDICGCLGPRQITIERLLELGETLPPAFPWKRARKELAAAKNPVEDNLGFEIIHPAEGEENIEDDDLVLVDDGDSIEDDYVEV